MKRYLLRPLAASDAPLIGRQHAAMCQEVGRLDPGEEVRLAALSETFVRSLLAQDAYVGFAAVAQDDPARALGGGGVWLQPRWPWMLEGKATPASTQGVILNVFVEPAHRRRGVARDLMRALEAECAARGVTKLTLHASALGRPLYESLGYTPTNEMALADFPRADFARDH